jgi:hypothetical protein
VNNIRCWYCTAKPDVSPLQCASGSIGLIGEIHLPPGWTVFGSTTLRFFCPSHSKRYVLNDIRGDSPFLTENDLGPEESVSKEFCAKSRRVDGKFHSWEFDGDDPWIVCCWCGERRRA